MIPILETTTRVYTKVWEMCALAGFLTGREVARRMVSRKRGTMLFTGATASVRGSNGFSAFAGGKHALRALAQSMAKELMPKNIHVAHVIIDGPIDTEWTRQRFPGMVKERPVDGLLQPDDIAETYWAIHNQKEAPGLSKPMSVPGLNHGNAGSSFFYPYMFILIHCNFSPQ